ncbi:MAG: 2Fe-2S iron-sulfur cluster-binding protein, partial [Wolinella sp.]
MVRLKIDGVSLLAHKNETILSVARRAGVYIPTLCYLPKVAPIASCRLCLVEESSTNGYILSCQTPVREGMDIRTKTSALESRRTQIMQFYMLNHPLECGVCDKSGECELQNRTLEFGISSQKYATKEKNRVRESWGNLLYDESLCIMCERCVRTCNEVIGNSFLRVSAGGFSSRIVVNEKSVCSECGECVAVCPVGALSSRAFHYTSNAWELQKISSSCTKCALACYLVYEVKRGKIYRISSDREFGALCGMGRFSVGDRSSMKKDKARFLAALEAFKKAESISFNSYITNEEALILQRLKESRGYKLINHEAMAFARFANVIHATSGGKGGASVKLVEQSDFVISFGGRFYDEMPLLSSAIMRAKRATGAILCILHPIAEERVEADYMLRYEVGAEEGVAATMCAMFCENPSDELGRYLDGLDLGYISSESSLSEDELEEPAKCFKSALSPTLIIGSDIYAHPSAL